MKEVTLTIRLNEPQLASFEDARTKFRGCHYADMVIRKNGQDYRFEVDYLRDAFLKALTQPKVDLIPK